MLKNFIRSMCQKLLGYNNYLYVFALFSIKRIQWGGGHEKEFLYFLDMVPNDGVILDIGANIGVMTVTLALKKDKAKVYAFEPVPDNIKTIEKVLKHHKIGSVTLFRTALGEESGEIRMVVPVVGNSNMQGLSHVVEDKADEAGGQYFTVPLQRLDDMKELQAVQKITAIKIDVENFEYYVLKGGRELLLKHKPVIYCELWDNERRIACMDYLRSLGYEVKIYENGALHTFNGQQGINFFFVPA
ncbi:FkbM family methyltransferase [Sediminibacterium ginsengisoli]|uniref:Methyltransferase, FkbM family n=1 Tax=Sediminibacterium ginsengisoli TaxID=413434 RepID=A0A1T4RN23_9BACT|nr:FkbM family methyltransferase [Sediminibacterium ginsengisoli]SKA17071.1 methyltransferase, FkbM family [Sediminibacterium ginsengisoli]